MTVTSGILGSRSAARLLRIAVLVALALGMALALPTKVVHGQTATTLVSNTGQTAGGTAPLNFDRSQAFTTGSHSLGYKLTSVQIHFSPVGALSGYGVEIMNDGGSGPGSTTVGTLKPPSTVSAGLNDFTGDVDLAAGTTYYVVIDSTADNSSTSVVYISSGDEDSGGADGWSIGDSHRWRNYGSSGSWSSTALPLKIAVNGYAKTVPVLTSAEINSAALALTFDQNLDTDSGTAANRFSIEIAGRSHTATGISISGRQVRLTVPAVKGGQFVTVSYSQPGSNRLKGDNGVAVAPFNNRGVTNNTPGPRGGTVRGPVTVTEGGATIEIRAVSAERGTLLSYYEDACRANPDARFDNPLSCAFHGLYLRQSKCSSADWRSRNGHILEAWCPENRTW